MELSGVGARALLASNNDRDQKSKDTGRWMESDVVSDDAHLLGRVGQ